MPWFKVDDKLHSHPKRHRAGLKAMGLWVISGSWSSDHLTDGLIPTDMLRTLGGTATDARRLVEAGLWDVVDGGWRFHHWQDQNPSRSDVEAQREAWRIRQQEAREKKKREREEGIAS